METEHATPELFAAVSAAQGEIENATKNATNPHFKSNYADLSEILNTIRPVFSKHGLALSQSPSFDGSLVSVTTILSHKSGGYMTGVASCVPAKTDAQGIGSSTTYLRRYAAAGMAGIAQEDDDGNGAAHDRKPAPIQKPANKPAEKPASKANPHKAAIDKLMANLIAGALDFGVVADKDAGLKWFGTLATEAAKNIGKKTADMSTEEFAMFEQAMVTYAADSAVQANADKDAADA